MQAYLLLHGMISNITSQQEENTYKTIFLFTVPSTKKNSMKGATIKIPQCFV